jgi:NitT/TauT family transport system ATP-binding protein
MGKQPTEGKIEVFGLQVLSREAMSDCFPEAHALPWFDVLGNVTFPVRNREGRMGDKDRQHAQDLLALVGLAGFERQRVHELSD